MDGNGKCLSGICSTLACPDRTFYSHGTREAINIVGHHQVELKVARLFPFPPVSVSRTISAPHAGDGVFSVRIENRGNDTLRSVQRGLAMVGQRVVTRNNRDGILQAKTWVAITSKLTAADLLEDLFYESSHPPTLSATTLHLTLSIPPQSVLIIKIPFTKLMLKYTEHRPDAERGIEIPSGTLTFIGRESQAELDVKSGAVPSGRSRLYTTRLLLDVPTPDFSMPYNVIIMSSTVMAIFFGLMQGTLTRRWGFVQVPNSAKAG
jgi:phosphatidylinositol glycan class T